MNLPLLVRLSQVKFIEHVGTRCFFASRTAHASKGVNPGVAVKTMRGLYFATASLKNISSGSIRPSSQVKVRVLIHDFGTSNDIRRSSEIGRASCRERE